MAQATTIPHFEFADYNTGFVIAIFLVAKPNEEEVVAKLLESLVQPSMAEPGVKLFLPYRSPNDPASFFLFELYVDEAAWHAHQQTAHFKTAIAQLTPRLSKRERIPFLPFVGML